MGFLLSKEAPPDSSTPKLMDDDWCIINWGENKENLRNHEPRNRAVDHLRILLVGPVGAGKSSFIHSIKSILQGKMTNAALTVSNSGTTFTKKYTTNTFEDQQGTHLKFVISDVPGLQSENDSGVQPKDLISVLKGHIKEDYKFNPMSPCSKNDTGYNHSPTLNDKVHCLVFIIPAENFSQHQSINSCEAKVVIPNDLIQKMQIVRQKACDLEIPHVVILTKVDKACPHVMKDIKLIFRSETIKKQVQTCSDILGVPGNCIFPVKNYNMEKMLHPNVDALLLFTLTQILDHAKDFADEKKEDGVGDPELEHEY